MTRTTPTRIDHFRGDATRLAIPAHADALRDAGPDFLTAAFHAFGALPPENRVRRIARFERCPGGSTGAKFFLTVEYETPDPALRTELFVKFSRDFDDERRDNPGRYEMAPEAPFMALTRLPGFPISVPEAYFADYELESGSGLVITECVPFGQNGIEPHRGKCLDHLTLDDPLPHYRQIVTALARLAAAHKSGKLAPDIDAQFPFDPIAGSADPIRYDEAGVLAKLQECFDFARDCPQLLPPEVRTPEFLERMQRDALRVRENEAAIQRYLRGNPDLIALCHWNAHIDNCFFWQDAEGNEHCGLIDWGRVGQLTFGSVLWGALSAAHFDIWDLHLRDLLELFVREYEAHGGPAITAQELEFHLTLHMAAMGIARVLAFPKVVLFRLPGCVNATSPRDPMFLPVDPARNCLHIYTVFLKFWLRQDFGAHLDRLLERLESMERTGEA